MADLEELTETHPEFCLVLCECCGSEGRVYRAVYPKWGEPYEEDLGECEACHGHGMALIPCEPITMEDLDHDCV